MQWDEGTVFVTVNRRLAAHLAERHDRHQQQAGRRAWSSPDILPLSAWLTRCREEIWPERPLLSAHQSNLLWESVIGDIGLLNRSAAAARAADAWSLMGEWRLDGWRKSVTGQDRRCTESLSADVRVFLDWADDYAGRLSGGGWDDADRLTGVVAGWLREGRIAPPAEVLFAGFDRESPALTDLKSALMDAGCRVGVWPEPVVQNPDVSPSNPPLLAAADMEEEATLAARWVRARLLAEADARVAIVVPDVAAYRPVLERALCEQLSPGSVAGAGEPVANFSLGGSLAQVPVVAGALSLLAVGRRPLPVAHLTGILNSPWLGGGEGPQRSLAAARIGSRRRGDMTLKGFLRDLNGVNPPLTLALLESWRAHLEGEGGRRRPSDWARRFADLFTTLGWPGEPDQHSHAYQAAGRFSTLLAEFAGLDLVSGSLEREKMDRDEAVRRIGAMAARTVFQPQGDSTVQVLGVLEAAGIDFDHLWLMGFGDHLWPPAAAPNPFLPIPLQRRLGMPRADAAAELAYARQITQRLLDAAPDRVVSHPLMVDGGEVSVSPLMGHLVPLSGAPDVALELPPIDLAVDVSQPHRLAEAGHLHALSDGTGPPLADGGGRGGVSLFADQAACPFKAFANHRLGARLDEAAGPGLDGAGRGSLVHRSLELLWRGLGGSEGLEMATGSGDLPQTIDTVVAEAVAEAVAGTGLSDGFSQLERRRVAALVAEWLEVERRRQPFTVVAAEQRTQARAGGVTVNTKIDRVDRLADGREVLIDYKTGPTKFSAWFGERPEAPQLPLYLTMRADPVAALAFATIKRGEMRFSGLGADADLLPGVDGISEARLPEGASGDWRTVADEWRRVLDQLGAAFVAGDARVDPKDDGACRYCHLDPLCRIWERDAPPPEAES